MNWNKVKKATSFKNNDFGVNAIMIGLPILIMLFMNQLLTWTFTANLITGIGTILFGALVFTNIFIFVSTIKYYGIRLTVKKWVTYMLVGVAVGIVSQMILALILPETIFVSMIVSIIVSVLVFSKIFKVKWQKAIEIMIVIKVIQLLVFAVPTLLGLGTLEALGFFAII